MATIALVANIRLETPERHLHIGSYREGLVVFGQNRFGMTSLRHFKNWAELKAHFEHEHLPLPEVNYAYRNLSSEVRLEAGDNGSYYRIFWKSSEGEKVMHAPDLASAEEISRHIRYQALEPSLFGYAIAVN